MRDWILGLVTGVCIMLFQLATHDYEKDGHWFGLKCVEVKETE